MESMLVKAKLNGGDKLERLNGLNYKHWSLKMEYLLTIAKVFYVLSESCPEEGTNLNATEVQNTEVVEKAKKWKNDDFICHYTIL